MGCLSLLKERNVNFVRNGGPNVIPGNVSLSFPGFDGEAILHRLDLFGICVSTGSACDSKETHISHVLQAIHLDDKIAKGTIRVSLGKNNTIQDTKYIAEKLIKILV